jgi:hypothetical protein
MNYAVMSGNTVLNIIVADSKEVAEEIVGATCILYTNENPACINGTYDGVDFIVPSPYKSWTLNSDKKWEAPVAAPTLNEANPKHYSWDEEVLSWVEVIITVDPDAPVVEPVIEPTE